MSIFIHIEKTGGNSLSQLMKKYSDEQIFKHSGHSDGYETFEIKGKFTKNKHQDLEKYNKIIPCGINDKGVSNLKHIKDQNYKLLGDKIIKNLIKNLKI